MSVETSTVVPGPGENNLDDLSDFKEGQWWVVELDAFAATSGATADQKRAVAVVHNLLRALKSEEPSSALPYIDRRVFKVGNVVAPLNRSTYTLHCGSGEYASAVVVSVEPLVLVSHSAGMRWESTVQPEKLMVVGDVDADELALCMKRL